MIINKSIIIITIYLLINSVLCHAQESPWVFGSKVGLNFINNLSIEYEYGAINSEGYSGFEIGSEFQFSQQLLFAPKLSYTFFPHIGDIINPCLGLDGMIYSDFEKIEPVLRAKFGVHLSALLEITYGYNWDFSNQTDFLISKHNMSLIFRLGVWNYIE